MPSLIFSENFILFFFFFFFFLLLFIYLFWSEKKKTASYDKTTRVYFCFITLQEKRVLGYSDDSRR